MLVLTVISYNGNPTNPFSATFDERGGAIGRADNNHMVLPDAERTVSRRHAQVTFRNGVYLIVNHGSNPIVVNGRELDKGREQGIDPSDTLQIGGYLLSVSAPQPVGAGDAQGDPFADLFGDSKATQVNPAASRVSAPTPPPATPRGHVVIPDDWDPFGSSPAALGLDPPSQHQTPQLVHGNNDLLENLFGLDGLSARDPLDASPPPIPDDFPDLRTPWEERVRAPASQPAPQSAPPGAVLSWEQAGQPQAAPFDKGGGLTPPTAAPFPAVPSAARPAPRAPIVGHAPDPAELLAALLEGLDVPTLRIEALTPSLMSRIGALLRESTRGTIELLAARAMLKREVRAEVTVIVARENNPLKFSPTVEIALQHMLGPLEKGYTLPVAAMQDAFDDLRAHNIGMMAGMRAALEGVLARFDPIQLEGQLVPRTGLAGLLPANRQARLWAAFESLHAQLARDAEDAFHELFGIAFVRAYEAHIDQLKSYVAQKGGNHASNGS